MFSTVSFAFWASFTAVMFHHPVFSQTPAVGGTPKGEMKLDIKDSGIIRPTKGDVAMVFYVTVVNLGHQVLHLTVNCTKCCLKPNEKEEDCETMNPIGGDMGELYPEDIRNLTLIYPTMYIHDRVGSCEIVIMSKEGKKKDQTVEFNTVLPKDPSAQIPRVLERYYDPDAMMKCNSTDLDPLNLCKPVACVSKYTGKRNYFNQTTGLCVPVPSCISKSVDTGIPTVAYMTDTNSCFDLKDELTKDEELQFEEGKPSVHDVAYSRRYPLNLECHKGELSSDGRTCVCQAGWSSAVVDPSSFNYDIQILHMCTIWTGETNAVGAANITFPATEHHGTNHAVLFVCLGVLFVVVAIILGIVLWAKSRTPKVSQTEESRKLTSSTSDDDS